MHAQGKIRNTLLKRENEEKRKKEKERKNQHYKESIMKLKETTTH